MKVKVNRGELTHNCYSDKEEFDKDLHEWFNTLKDKRRADITKALQNKSVLKLFACLSDIYSFRNITQAFDDKLRNSILLLFIDIFEREVSDMYKESPMVISSALSYMCLDSLVFNKKSDEVYINEYNVIVNTNIDTLIFTEEYLNLDFKFKELFYGCYINTVQFPSSYETQIDTEIIINDIDNKVQKVEFK